MAHDSLHFFLFLSPLFPPFFLHRSTPQLYFSGRLVPASCEHGGSTGVDGRNVWFVDTKSVEQGALQTPQPLALGFWMAYATPQGVANLPRLNLAAALADTVNMWFIPPLCKEPGAVCGVAYGFSPYWEPGVAAQQIVNLRWLVALMFPAVDHDWFGLMNARMNETMPIGTTAQVLGFYFQPDVRTTGLTQRGRKGAGRARGEGLSRPSSTIRNQRRISPAPSSRTLRIHRSSSRPIQPPRAPPPSSFFL